MKALLSFIVLIASLNSFASVDSIKLILEQTEVEKLAETLRAKSFELSKIEDDFAESGVRPRCLCESYKLTFSKVEYVAGASKKSVQVYSVNTSAFGTSLKVTINQEK
jgi:hypothetical protein